MQIKSIIDSYRYREDLGIIFNYRNGVIHRLENDVAKKIFSYAMKGFDIDLIIRCIVDEYNASFDLVRDDVISFFDQINPNNTKIERQWYSIDKGFDEPLNFPIRMEIEVTALCNWNCGFCYNVWKIDPNLSDLELKRKIKSLPQKYLPKEDAFRIIDELSEKGCFVVRYSGGETTLHPDLQEILAYGAEKKMFQVLFTNGHYLTPDYCKELEKNNVRSVLISLHGNEGTQNDVARREKAYEYTMNGIKNAINAGIEVIVETTLIKENEEQIEEIIDNIYTLGVTEYRVMRYVDTGKEDEKYAVPMQNILPLMQKIKELKDYKYKELNVGWPCGQKFCTSVEDSPISTDDKSLPLRFEQLTGHCESGLVWGSISYDGRIRNCPHSNVYHGDINSSDIETSWKRMTQRVHEVVKPRESCVPCDLKSVCKGGCHLPHFIEKKNDSFL